MEFTHIQFYILQPNFSILKYYFHFNPKGMEFLGARSQVIVSCLVWVLGTKF